MKLELDSKTVGALLKSPEMRADLDRRAKRIATAAGPGMKASSMVGRTRVRASVITATTEARIAEATDRKLTKSLRAGA